MIYKTLQKTTNDLTARTPAYRELYPLCICK